jgi:hypothetical protein
MRIRLGAERRTSYSAMPTIITLTPNAHVITHTPGPDYPWLADGTAYGCERLDTGAGDPGPLTLIGVTPVVARADPASS